MGHFSGRYVSCSEISDSLGKDTSATEQKKKQILNEPKIFDMIPRVTNLSCEDNQNSSENYHRRVHIQTYRIAVNSLHFAIDDLTQREADRQRQGSKKTQHFCHIWDVFLNDFRTFLFTLKSTRNDENYANQWDESERNIKAGHTLAY